MKLRGPNLHINHTIAITQHISLEKSLSISHPSDLYASLTRFLRNITCILREHHKKHQRTSHVYYINIKCTIFGTWHFWLLYTPLKRDFYRTSLVYHVNIVKNIEHHMYTICKSIRFHKTSLIYYVNIKCVLCEHQKIQVTAAQKSLALLLERGAAPGSLSLG
jgi:hypothetical protein